jgi:hypothetical protein
MSWLENEPCSSFRAVPKRFHVTERNWLDVDPERGCCGRLKKPGEGLKNLLHRSAAKAASQEFNCRAAQSGGGQSDGFAGALSNLDKSDSQARVTETLL